MFLVRLLKIDHDRRSNITSWLLVPGSPFCKGNGIRSPLTAPPVLFPVELSPPQEGPSIILNALTTFVLQVFPLICGDRMNTNDSQSPVLKSSVRAIKVPHSIKMSTGRLSILIYSKAEGYDEGSRSDIFFVRILPGIYLFYFFICLVRFSHGVINSILSPGEDVTSWLIHSVIVV